MKKVVYTLVGLFVSLFLVVGNASSNNYVATSNDLTYPSPIETQPVNPVSEPCILEYHSEYMLLDFHLPNPPSDPDVYRTLVPIAYVRYETPDGNSYWYHEMMLYQYTVIVNGTPVAHYHYWFTPGTENVIIEVINSWVNIDEIYIYAENVPFWIYPIEDVNLWLPIIISP